MPYIVTCPKCSTKLKSAQPVPAGRSVSCPSCKTQFTLSEPARAMETQPVSNKLPAKVPKKGSRAEIDDIEPAEFVDDDEPELVRKKPKRPRDEDENDRPRSRRRDDDDEIKPRARRTRDD